jgi:hypothetical protein
MQNLMKRRAMLTLGAGAAAFVFAGYSPAVAAADERKGLFATQLADLEPDGMWTIYRRYHLVIVGQRDDAIASGFAVAAVDVLARFLPASRAQLARAPDTRRVGVLLGTNQQDVAIMAAESAEALFLAKPPFEDLRNVPLRLIVSFGSHVLVCRPDFPARHAYLLAQTLVAHNDALPAPATAPAGVVPAHPGSHAFFTSGEMPDE